MEEGGKFGFCRTGEDFAHDLAQDIDGAIGRWKRVIGLRGLVRIFGGVAQVVVATGTGSSLGFRQI